ncbi:MAG: L,D-transpeptidase family protein [Nitrosomonadaceae bacterium]
MKKLHLFIITILCLSFSQVNQAAAEEKSQIRSWVERIKSGNCAKDKDCPISSVILLPELYKKYSYQPIWTNPGSVRQLVDAIKDSYHDGLTPEDYHLSLIQQLQKALVAKPDPAKRAKLDVVLTDSLVRLGYHLLMGKVDPESLDRNWNMDRTLKLDPILKMSVAIDNAQVTGLVAGFRPKADFYRDLKQVLANYRKIQAEGGWPQVPAGETLKPGMTTPRVTTIRQRLVVTTDMPAVSMESSLYDAAVEAGVKQFQQRHGFEADGIVGKGTLAAMNVPIKARIGQLRVNLDRARWVLHDLPQDFVVTDIAGFNLLYIRNGQEAWKTRVQVGKTYRKTPVFRDRIRYIEFNPTWTIPPGILRKDILPKVKRDPQYLQNKNMVVLNQQGKQIDIATIDWSQYPGKGFPYLIRQQPGPNNALGRVKFIFPNKHSVYLHDTPSKSGFKRAERAFSSGCIRVQNPFHFAELLLADKPGWDRAKIDAVVESRKTTRVNLSKPLTVMLLYWTAAVDNERRVVFKQDIYDRDGAVLVGLDGKFKFRGSKIIE